MTLSFAAVPARAPAADSSRPPVLPLDYLAVMAQRQKRSVSLPPGLADAIERAARDSGISFSAWLAETATQRLRLKAGREAIAEWEHEHGRLTEAELADGRARARRLLAHAPVARRT